MPFDEKLILDDAIVVEFLADGRHKLLHFGVRVDEELNQGLKEVNDTSVRVLISQASKYALVSIPMLRYVAMRSKNGAHADVHLVFTSDIQLELLLTYFSKDFICTGRVTQISFLISDKGLEFLAGGDYIKRKEVKNRHGWAVGHLFESELQSRAIKFHLISSAVVTKNSESSED